MLMLMFLIFVIAALGSCATYLTKKRSNSSTTRSFDVGCLNLPFCSIYGYALLVAAAFYFLLQYLGSNASLVRCWCLWGYIFCLHFNSQLCRHPTFWLSLCFIFCFSHEVAQVKKYVKREEKTCTHSETRTSLNPITY